MDAAEKAVKQAERSGAEQAEAFLEIEKVVTIEIDQDKIGVAQETESKGLAVRAFLNKTVGFAYTSNLERFKEIARSAVEIARVSKPDPDLTGFPMPKSPAKVKDTFDKRINELSLETAVEMAMRMAASAREIDARVKPTNGYFTALTSFTQIVNSNDISVSDEGTYISAQLHSVAKEGQKTSSGYESQSARKLEMDLEWIGRQSAKLALEGLDAESISTKKIVTILKPRAVQELFHYALIPALSAEAVQRNRSIYKGKLEEEVAANLTIIDDGVIPAGLNTMSVDGEGTPTQKTTVVRDGVLKGFLYDWYTARKENVESTGNAVRSSYSVPPSIGPTNFVVEEKESTVELIEETKEGILVYGVIGAHTANPVSGDFGCETRNTYLVEEGEIKTALKRVMISGNLPLLLRKTLAGNDTRQIGAVRSPTLQIRDVQVVGD